jgi:hypothetical protein
LDSNKYLDTGKKRKDAHHHRDITFWPITFRRQSETGNDRTSRFVIHYRDAR